MNRITPGMVVDAYNTTGLKVIRKSYFSKETQCGCALTAVYASVIGISNVKAANVCDFACKKYGMEYADEFMCGFDGADIDDKTHIGYADGLAAWHACVVAGLVDDEHMHYNIITRFERATGSNFLRVDGDGTYLFECDREFEVGYALDEMEEIIGE